MFSGDIIAWSLGAAAVVVLIFERYRRGKRRKQFRQELLSEFFDQEEEK